MREYLIRRLLLIPITLLGITFITFAIIRLAPGDPAATKFKAQQMTGSGAATDAERGTEAAIVKFRKKWHLDKPILVQYSYWLKSYLCLDFGNAMVDDKPIAPEMGRRLMVTIPINILVFIIIYTIAIPIGIFSATHQYTKVDTSTTVLLFILYSLPTFWVATLLQLLLCNPDYLKIFPALGLHSDAYRSLNMLQYLFDLGHHLVLPIICMTYGGFAYLSRQMRAAMLETIRQDYIRTARAKGLAERVVVMKHALRNSLIPIVTLMGTLLPAMVGGSIIIETIFEIPGIGRYAYTGILNRDYNIVMATATLSAVLTLAGLLLADLIYVVVDPRISFSKAGGDAG